MKDLKNLNCLLPKTKELLLRLIGDCPFLKNYVLVGGSALSLHLCHRKSEDLDFFTYGDAFSKQEILNYILYTRYYNPYEKKETDIIGAIEKIIQLKSYKIRVC